jgi:carbamoyltransferase
VTRTVSVGINAAHDAAVAVTIDGELVVAIAEERLSRKNHHEGFPQRALEYCLSEARLRDLRDVNVVVLNEYVKDDYDIDLGTDAGSVIVNPSHHLLHAYYAWTASGFDRPAILVVDGSGYSYGEYERRGSPLIGAPPSYSEMEECESMYVVDTAGDLALVRKRWGLWEAEQPFLRFPSLGHMYSMASEYIFGHMQHAGKTMGLAPYGNAAAFPNPMVEYKRDGISVDTTWVKSLPPRSEQPAEQDVICRNLAAKVQSELEQAMLFLCNELHRATGATHLCLSGGVGLNSVTNGLILRETPFSRLFVTPAAGDSGIAIGAAIFGHHTVTGKTPSWPKYDNYHGRPYREEDVAQALAKRARFVRAESVRDVTGAATRDISAGLFVGWFEGRSEFGPRALGCRSIVCDPRPPDMKARLNEAVKFREPFRPYAASVLAEHVDEYFDVVADDRFMLTVAAVKPDRIDGIASVCHVDGTCRIQTVEPDHPGSYRKLVERFYAESGVPLVLNTSFNIRGEPIVESPDDAVRCFLSCNLDVLYLCGLRVTKALVADKTEDERLVPALAEGTSLEVAIPNVCGAVGAPSYSCITRTGHVTELTQNDFSVMAKVDGQKSFLELAQSLSFPPRSVVAQGVSLQRRGLLWIAYPGQ